MNDELFRPLSPHSLSSRLSEPRFTSSADTVPQGSRCVLTLATGPSLSLCRLIPGTTRPATIRRLEHFWRIPPGTFDTDAPHNIMILRSDLNLAFNQLEWVLVPTEDVLVRIRNWQRENYTRIRVGSSPGYLEAFPNRDDWEYILMAFRLQKPISRLHLPDQPLEQTCMKTGGEDFDDDGDRDHCGPSDHGDDAKGRIADLLNSQPPVQHAVFDPPYADFPRIKSHIHPFYVIYAAAEAFQRNWHIDVSPEHNELGHLAACIASVWKQRPIPSIPMSSSAGDSYRTSQDSDRSTESLRSEDMDDELLRPLPPHSISSFLSEPRSTASADTAPRGSRCLLTLETSPSLRLCRLIPGTTRPTTIRRLEHFWRVPPGTFDINTPHNITILRSDLNLAFNQFEWVLVPTEDVLVRIRSWQMENYERIRVGSSPGYLEEFPNRNDWEYVLIAFRLDKPISRLSLPNESLEQTCFKIGGEDFDDDGDRDCCGPSGHEHDAKGRLLDSQPPVQHAVFVPPYTDFPRIKSHIHPFFVIYAASEAFQYNLRVSLNPEHYRLADLAFCIASMWKQSSIPRIYRTGNEAPKPMASALAPSKPQESNAKGHSPPPPRPGPQDSLIKVDSMPSKPDLEPHPSLVVTPELKDIPTFETNGLSRSSFTAHASQVIYDPGVEKWVDEVVLRTRDGELEPLEESYPVQGDVQEGDNTPF